MWSSNMRVFVMCAHTQLRPTLCDPMDCNPTRLLCPWNFPGKNAGVGCHLLLQGIFPTQRRTRTSCIFCTAGGFFTAEPPGKPTEE